VFVAWLIVTGALAVASFVLVALSHIAGWVYVAGIGTGIGATVLVLQFVDWNRHRQLRELLDWLGEDLEARKLADLRHDQRIKHLRGQLP